MGAWLLAEAYAQRAKRSGAPSRGDLVRKARAEGANAPESRREIRRVLHPLNCLGACTRDALQRPRGAHQRPRDGHPHACGDPDPEVVAELFDTVEVADLGEQCRRTDSATLYDAVPGFFAAVTESLASLSNEQRRKLAKRRQSAVVAWTDCVTIRDQAVRNLRRAARLPRREPRADRRRRGHRALDHDPPRAREARRRLAACVLIEQPTVHPRRPDGAPPPR